MPGTQVHPSSSRATPTEDSEPVLELGGRALLGVSFGSSTACLCVVKVSVGVGVMEVDQRLITAERESGTD